MDLETDTVYLRNRHYNPYTAQFISEDPYWKMHRIYENGPQGLNLYAYCINNPIMFIDPTGLDSWVLWASYGDHKDTDDNRKQAAIRAAAYEKQYKSKSHIIEIKSAEDFVWYWDEIIGAGKGDPMKVGFNKIDAVEVISHGTYGTDSKGRIIGNLMFKGSYFYAQEHDKMNPQDRSIANLITNKTIDTLYFSACNTANQDFNVSIVQAFYDKMTNISEVSGWDGGVGFVFASKNPFFIAERDYPVKWEDQDTFRGLRKPGDNRQPGKITLPSKITLPRT